MAVRAPICGEGGLNIVIVDEGLGTLGYLVNFTGHTGVRQLHVKTDHEVRGVEERRLSRIKHFYFGLGFHYNYDVWFRLLGFLYRHLLSFWLRFPIS